MLQRMNKQELVDKLLDDNGSIMESDIDRVSVEMGISVSEIEEMLSGSPSSQSAFSEEALCDAMMEDDLPYEDSYDLQEEIAAFGSDVW